MAWIKFTDAQCPWGNLFRIKQICDPLLLVDFIERSTSERK